MIFASACSKKSKENFSRISKITPIEQTKVYKDFGASCNETTIAGVTADLDLSQLKHYLK
jgi:hypothetical protein